MAMITKTQKIKRAKALRLKPNTHKENWFAPAGRPWADEINEQRTLGLKTWIKGRHLKKYLQNRLEMESLNDRDYFY